MSVVSLVAIAACGDDDDDDTTATEAVSGTDAESPATSGDVTTPSDTSDTTAATEAPEGEDEAPPGTATAGETHVEDDEGDPVSGGTLVYGLEADSANAWAPYRVSCAASCYVILSAISDSLFAVTDEGEVAPMLVESFEPNDDYTQWTLHIRDGITFHDGTPLDGEAVKFNMDSCVNSPLTGAAYAAIDTITASGQDVTITTRGGPWVALPALFAGTQCGYMFSKEWLQTLPDVPQRQEGSRVYDAALAGTPASGNPAEPVGLGPFVYESYTPGNGNSFTAVRNEDYWRGPNGITGENLPYLDGIEAVVSVDVDTRSNSLQSGEFDVIHTANADTINQYLGDDAFETTATSRYADTGYVMLNLAEGEADPEGKNAANPLLNVNCRRALAYAVDQQRLSDERGAGLVGVANGPYPPGSVGWLEDTGYPSFDLDRANEELDTCLSALGTDSIEFTFNTTNDPFNVETNTLVASMWTEAFGDRVRATITPIEQGQYIGLALTGAFQAFAWRSHAGFDPDQQRHWWQSSSSAPIGALALNFGRFKDEVIDEALLTIRTNPDPAARQAAAEAVNQRFGEQVYNLWLTYTLWGIISEPYVNGVEANVLPDGTEGVGMAFGGRHQLVQMWCDEGSCE